MKYIVNFNALEEVWFENEAIVDAESKEEAFNLVKDCINSGRNPFAIFDATQKEVIECVHTKEYEIASDHIGEIPYDDFVKEYLPIVNVTDIQKAQCKPSRIYTVIIYAVFGGIDSVESFISETSAYKYFFDWANSNNTENLVFDDVSEALEWFRCNETELDYTIDFFEYEINNENETQSTGGALCKA